MGTATVGKHLAASDVKASFKPSTSTWKVPGAELGLKEAGEGTGVHGQAEEELAEPWGRGGRDGNTGHMQQGTQGDTV